MKMQNQNGEKIYFNAQCRKQKRERTVHSKSPIGSKHPGQGQETAQEQDIHTVDTSRKMVRKKWIQKCLKTYIASIHKQHPRRGGAGGVALPVLLKVHFQENFFPMEKRGLISGFLIQGYKFTP